MKLAGWKMPSFFIRSVGKIHFVSIEISNFIEVLSAKILGLDVKFSDRY